MKNKENEEPLLILILLVVAVLTGAAGLWAMMMSFTADLPVDVPLMVLLSALVWWWMAEMLRAMVRRG